ncbi:MAG: hypothetical protein ACXVZP_06135 [Gaiellaceae bacterium]
MSASGTAVETNPLQRLGSLRLAADETLRGVQMQARRIHADIPEDERLYLSCACRRETDVVFLVLLLQRLQLIAEGTAMACDDEQVAAAARDFALATEPLGRLRNVLRQSEGYSSRPCDPGSPALHWMGKADGSAFFFERAPDTEQEELVERRVDVIELRDSAERLAALVVDAIEREVAKHGC